MSAVRWSLLVDALAFASAALLTVVPWRVWTQAMGTEAWPVGMGVPEQTPLPSGCRLASGRTVLDMVYRPLETALLREARANGCRAVDGLWMLVYQALEQLRLWTGRSVPDEVAVELHAHLKAEAT